MAKLLQTKRDGVCSSCETRLEIGSSAYWSQAERTLTCTACYSATEVRPAASFRPAAIAVSTSLASALPPPSPLLVTQTVPAWPSPPPAPNIDHIAVTPSGVYVIDAKKYAGRLEERNVGGAFRPDQRLYVNGRDRTKLAAGVTSQVEAVRDLLASVPGFANVHVGGVLCFIGCDWAKLRTFTINGVTAIWPRGLSEYLIGCTDQAVDVASVAAHLSTTLKQPTR
jgi:hypothetical protein